MPIAAFAAPTQILVLCPQSFSFSARTQVTPSHLQLLPKCGCVWKTSKKGPPLFSVSPGLPVGGGVDVRMRREFPHYQTYQ
jgi:hypothetical protein